MPASTLRSLLGLGLSWRARGVVVRLSVGFFAIQPIMLLFFGNLFSVGLHVGRLEAFELAVLAVVLLEGSVVLHEIGHVLAAREVGNPAHMIELTAFGGATATGGEGPGPGASARMAVAGIAVNTVIFAATALVTARVTDSGLGEVLSGLGHFPTGDRLTALLWTVMGANSLLVFVNALPMLPLDGGKLVRAGLWRVTGSRHRATEATALASKGFSVLIAAAGAFLLLRGNVFVGALCMWSWPGFWRSAGRSIKVSALAERMTGIVAGDVMDASPATIPAALPIARLGQHVLPGANEPYLPVVDAGQRYLGMLRTRSVVGAAPGARARDLVTPPARDVWVIMVPPGMPLRHVLAFTPVYHRGAAVVVDEGGRLRGVIDGPRVQGVLDALESGSRPYWRPADGPEAPPHGSYVT